MIGEFELNKIYCMDCLEGLKKIPDNSIDLIVTDPPYNIGKSFANDNLSKEDFLIWSEKWIYELQRICKWGGAIYLTLGWKYVAETKIIFNKYENLRLKNWIIWYRQDGWKGDKGFSQSYEHLLYFIKDNMSKERLIGFRNWMNEARKKKGYSLSFINKKLGWASSGGGCASGYLGEKEDMQIPSPFHFKLLKELLDLDSSYDELVEEEKYIKFNKTDVCDDVWLNPKSEKNRLGHPTQKPIKLFERIIIASSNSSDIILDPFMGSGTTALASKQLNRKFIGFEISPEYCKIANERLNQETLKLGVESESV